MHDPLEDWAEKDRLLAEIGVELPSPVPVAPPPPPEPPRSPAFGPVRVVARPALPDPVEAPPSAAPPPAFRGAASVILLGVGVAWLAAGAGAGSASACLAGLGFLAAGSFTLVPLLRS